MPVWLTYLLISLTTFSVTRLVIKDEFPPIRWPRDRMLDLAERHDNAFTRSYVYLWTCPWCMSVWVGSLVVWAFTFFVSVPLPVVAVIVARAVTGLIAQNLDADE